MRKIFITLLCVVSFAFSGVEVFADELTANYYETRGTLTRQVHPESDWEFVIVGNVAPPSSVDLVDAWVDYAANTILTTFNYSKSGNVGGDCEFGTIALVNDAKLILDDFESLRILEWMPVTCEAFTEALRLAMNRGI